jgi:phosphoserine phosphatase
MHRISAKQNALLDQLHMRGKRIEKLSKIEHDLIKEVHPQVAEIRDGLDAMVTAVKDNTEQISLVSKEK